MLNWEQLAPTTDYTFEEHIDIVVKALNDYRRLVAISQSFMNLCKDDANRRCLQVVVESVGVNPHQKVEAVFEDFTTSLRNIKDRIVKLIKDLVAKLKDVGFNLMNTANVEKVKAKIEANKAAADALGKIVAANPNAPNNITEKLATRNKGSQSHDAIVGRLTAILDAVNTLKTVSLAKIKEAANTVKNSAPETPAPANTNTDTTTATPAAQATPINEDAVLGINVAAFKASIKNAVEGGTWSLPGLNEVQAKSETFIPDVPIFKTISDALKAEAKELDTFASGISASNEADKNKLTAVTKGLKVIKDATSVGNTIVREMDSCTKDIAGIISTMEAASK